MTLLWESVCQRDVWKITQDCDDAHGMPEVALVLVTARLARGDSGGNDSIRDCRVHDPERVMNVTRSCDSRTRSSTTLLSLWPR